MIDDFRSPSVSKSQKAETKPKPRARYRTETLSGEPLHAAAGEVNIAKLHRMLGPPPNISAQAQTELQNAVSLPHDTPPEVQQTPKATEPEESKAAAPEHSTSAPEQPAHPKKPSKLRSWWHGRSKRQRVLISVLALVFLAAGSGVPAYYVAHKDKPKAIAIVKPKPKKVPVIPKVTTVASTLTGLQVDPTVNQRPVTGVMIENSLDARPQSGLDQAGVVFEAIAEGGITRFLALYQDTQPDYIGPVRSSRPYYLSWLLGFDAGYAHVGGSPQALKDIKLWNVRDLDQFYNSGAYQRVSNRYAPHNVYTSSAKLSALEAAKGYTGSTFQGFERKKEAASQTPNASSIDIKFSGTYYNTHYDYDATTNSYKRSEGGSAHMEVNAAGAQTQITPKVVIALVLPYGLASDGYHSDYQTLGTGQVYVFQDGVVTPGTWTKTANTDQLKFTDTEGHALPLNPGQTWIAAVSSAGNVTYK